MTTIQSISLIVIHIPILVFKSISEISRLILSVNIASKESFYVWPNQEISNIFSYDSCDYLLVGDGNKEKKGILLTARVHPGETMSSYIIEYIIDFLLGNSALARNLR